MIEKNQHKFLFLTVLAVIVIDFLTKVWAGSLGSEMGASIVGLALHQNEGAALGFFSGVSPYFRIVTFCTFGAFMISIYALIQYFLPPHTFRLRFGLALLLGGILGNVIDRFSHGYVVDFIYLGPASGKRIVLNVADIIQWFGYFFIATGIFKHRETIWRNQEMRKNVWINPKYQFRFCLSILVLGTCYLLTIAVFSIAYIKNVVEEVAAIHAPVDSSKFVTPYFLSLVFISAVYLIIVIFFSIRESHKTAGPIFSFERYLNVLISGEDKDFRLRARDEYKHLEQLGAKLRAYIKELKSKSSKS